MSKVTELQPTTVEYRDHTIKLTHRPKTNDWVYEFQHTRSLRVSDFAPRHATAVDNAKRKIDILLGDKR